MQLPSMGLESSSFATVAYGVHPGYNRLLETITWSPHLDPPPDPLLSMYGYPLSWLGRVRRCSHRDKIKCIHEGI
ncbi:hypothetical protein AMECASPLE_022492 [Ameca splendens]|uniref:Uncharacterized protein n=1 Tax=Ameca splendens TaxID=208324 RepID=A0ABV0XGV4_9TELE